MDVVLKRDKLIVGQYSTSPPLAYVDDNGELVGFEIDMAREIAKDLLGDPKKVEFVVLQSDGRFPAALSGKIDFGLCSTTITGDRAARIAFTRPYLDTGGSIIARKDAGIQSLKDLVGKRVAVFGLSSNWYLALSDRLQEAGIDPKSVRFLSMPYPQMEGALVHNEVDAAVMTSIGAYRYVAGDRRPRGLAEGP